MNNVKKLSLRALISGCAFICITASSALFAHEDKTDHPIEAQKITDSIYLLSGKGGNIGVSIGEDGTFLIDDKFAPLSDAILEVIKEVGGDTPKFIVNTHFHGDHTGGNENFGKQGSIIVAHQNVRKRLQEDNFIAAFNFSFAAQPKIGLPVVTFADSISFHLNDEQIEVTHIPNSHTDGDSVIYFTKANVLHTGDLLFNGFYPFIDTDHGGSLAGLIAGVESLLTLINDQTVVIPGHGPIGNQQDLMAYHAMLKTANQKLSELRVQGKSVEEVIALKPLASLDKDWAGGIFTSDKWIGLIYPSL
jgi:glyoxylase-like metal-dependent hydrolase (beta-lactamase superfamily II)